MTARLPNPGGDDNTWGQILNDFLSQVHNPDGTLKPLNQSQITNLTSDLASKLNTADLDTQAAALISNSSSATTNNLKTAYELSLNPLNYGAVGNGTTDDVIALNAALAAAKSRGVAVVDGGGRSYKVSNKIIVDSVALKNCVINLSGANACVRLTGTAPRIEKASINGDATALADFWGANGGCINLVGSMYANIEDVTVNSAVKRVAVYTSSAASFTRINSMRTFTAWGVLFNDTSFVDRTNIDGVNYSSQPIGKGLTITDCDFFGPADSSFTGDAVEVNAPTMRFGNVDVRNCRVWQTFTSANVGMAFGFANVDHVAVDGCYAENVPSPAGAYHSEFCTDVKFTNNTAKNCRSGIAVEGATGALVTGNRLEGCWEFSFKSQNNTSSTNSLSIIDNTFIGLVSANGVTAQNDIVVGNAKYVTVSRNKFLGMGMAGLNCIQFLKYGTPLTGVSYAEINENLFANTTGFAAAALVFFDPLTRSLHSAGNNFTNYTGPANGFLDRVSTFGVCEDFYTGASSQIDGSDKGLRGMTGGTPQGWVSGAAGRVMDDVVNGVRYKYDVTAATWTIPGGAYSNPIRIGSYYLWVDTAGTLRIKSSAPANATDGTSVGSQT
jgi:hypothetical protein